jgi:hypothetical protein
VGAVEIIVATQNRRAEPFPILFKELLRTRKIGATGAKAAAPHTGGQMLHWIFAGYIVGGVIALIFWLAVSRDVRAAGLGRIAAAAAAWVLLWPVMLASLAVSMVRDDPRRHH